MPKKLSSLEHVCTGKPSSALKYQNLYTLFKHKLNQMSLFGYGDLYMPRSQVENRYYSAGKARRFFHSVTRNNSSVIPRLFAIVAEQQRKQLVDAAQR